MVAVPSAVTGAICAVFLRVLALCTDTRVNYPWLLFLLPAAGVVVAGMYEYLGKTYDKDKKVGPPAGRWVGSRRLWCPTKFGSPTPRLCRLRAAMTSGGCEPSRPFAAFLLCATLCDLV